MAIRIRLTMNGVVNNKGEINLYDVAMPFAALLVCWEFEFHYSYPDAQCIFEIEDVERFNEWVKIEARQYEFDTL